MACRFLERCNCDRHGLGLKPIPAILLRSWEKHFTTHSPDERSWQAVLNFRHIFIKLKKKKKIFSTAAISWHLCKQVGLIAFSLY